MNRLLRPVDPASVAVFRIVFATMMLGQAVRYLVYDRVTHYFATDFTFTWMGFGWVQPLPHPWMHVVFVAQIVVLTGMILGWYYRLCAAAFCLLFGYEFLLEQAHYQNHHYLIWLLSLLLVFVPAHAAWSIDARRKPELRAAGLPAWGLGILAFQVGIAYFFAAVAKMNSDWLRGEPMREWLFERADTPIIGPVFGLEASVWIFAYGGLLLDLLVVPLLIWRRTRLVMYVLIVAFHLLNAIMFRIGVFPWLMIAGTPILFPASWPRRIVPKRWAPAAVPTRPPRRSRLVLLAVGVYVVIQLLLPLRHWLYPGPTKWTEEGHCFAWRMMLRSKRGQAVFRVSHPESGQTWHVDPRSELREWQYERMTIKPDLVQQYAYHLADRYSERAGGRVEVYAFVVAQVNDYESQPLVDRTVDLAARPRRIGHDPWITEFSGRRRR